MTTRAVTLAIPAVDFDTGTSTYTITSDKATSGTFATVTTLSSALNGVAGYAPFLSSVSGAITKTDTTITVLSGTEDDLVTASGSDNYIVIGKELVKLGTQAANVFTDCLRAQGGTLPTAHADGAIIYGVHLSYSDPLVNFTDRGAIRYRVYGTQSTTQSEPIEYVAYNPTIPAENTLTMVYDAVTQHDGTPYEGVDVTVKLSAADALLTTGEFVYNEQLTTTTDADGYWELAVPRNIARDDKVNITFSIQKSDNDQAQTKIVSTIPDSPTIHYGQLEAAS